MSVQFSDTSAFDDDDNLSPEVKDEAPEKKEQAPEAELPEKFKGKSAKDIAKMYEDLEKVVGRQGNELGELRRTYDEVLRSALTTKTAKPDDSKDTESVDDTEFFLNPRKAIEKAVEQHPLVKELRSKTEMTQAERAKAAFAAKHPDANEVLQDPEFRDWVQSSRVRSELLMRAHRDYDVDAGDELFSTYKQLKGIKAKAEPQADKGNDADEVLRESAVKAGKMPSGNAAPADSSNGKKVFRRADLIRLKMTDPARYEAMGDEILAAYAEGRVK